MRAPTEARRRAGRLVLGLGVVLGMHCGGNVQPTATSELGPACDPKLPSACALVNECHVCVFVGTGGLCGHGCKSAADCGPGYGCRKTHAYAYDGPCTKWPEDVGYCAELHATFGALCAVVDDCQTTASGCAICGQGEGDAAYRCRKACAGDGECAAPQRCLAPPVTAAYVSLSACAKPERFCQ